jgi:hypothetical protein
MKAKIRLGCEIADLDAKRRIEQHADVAANKNIYLALDVFEVEPLPDDST